jgi:ZIP family zinc transporter
MFRFIALPLGLPLLCRRGASVALWTLIPLFLLKGLLPLPVVAGNELSIWMAAPMEEIIIDRITLPAQDQIVVEVTNGGADPVTVVQVQVDDAYWRFTISPRATIPRLGQATITLPYPWVQDEAHVIRIISSSGATFEGAVDAATLTAPPALATFWHYTLLGVSAGFLPIDLGLVLYPFLRRLGRRATQAGLSLLVGLLLFLFFDILIVALETMAATAAVFGGAALVFLVGLLGFLILSVLHGTEQAPSQRRATYRLMAGIGLHNLSQGLAIGAALGLGQTALSVLLVIGFTLHNIMEGISIAASIAHERPARWQFIGLVLLAGLVMVPGIWIGAFVYNNLAAGVFLALGAGAIAQEVYAGGRIVIRQRTEEQTSLLSAVTLGGLVVGIVIMYMTVLFVAM